MGSLFRFAKVLRMDLNKAEKAISAGRQAAQEMGVNFSLAIMDIGANLVAFVRMDGCPVGCTDVAMKKARTAALFGFETGMLGKMSQPGKPLYGVEHSNGGLITFPGGVPIKDAQGALVGSVGVSGGSVEQDLQVAQAAASAFQNKHFAKL